MTVAALSTHKCTITRVMEPTPSDDDVREPVDVITTIGANVPCRFDRVSGRRVVGVTAQVRVVGRLFIDSAYNLNVHEKDIIEIDGETGKYSIERLDKVFAANTFHHYEIDLTDNKPQ